MGNFRGIPINATRHPQRNKALNKTLILGPLFKEQWFVNNPLGLFFWGGKGVGIDGYCPEIPMMIATDLADLSGFLLTLEALESGAFAQIFEGNALAFESLSLTTNFT